MDATLFFYLYNFGQSYSAIQGLVVAVAEYLPYLVSIIFLAKVFYFYKPINHRIQAIGFTLAALAVSSGLVQSLLHILIDKNRPFVEFGLQPLFQVDRVSHTFPSGHAIFFFTLATIAWLIFSKRWGIFHFTLAFLIGLARVVSGVHYPSDILASALIGMICVIGLKYALYRHLEFRPQRKKWIFF